MSESATPSGADPPATSRTDPFRTSASPLWRWIVPMPRERGRGWPFTLRWILGRLLLFVGLICVLLAWFQRSLIYHPATADRISVSDAGLPPGLVHDVTVKSSVGDLHGWHMLAADQSASSEEEAARLLADAPFVVLYFSGNAGNRTYRPDLMLMSARHGGHVFLIDYRGYGENPGTPSEAGLHEDARAAWKMLTEARRVPASKIVLLGESLGGGVATRLAADLCREGTPPGGLILQATFSSLTDAAAWHFPWLPVRLLLVDRFPSDEVIGQVTCPIVHFHGTQDSIVPIALGKKLFAAAPKRSASGVPKEFLEIPQADHNDIIQVGGTEINKVMGRFFSQVKQGERGASAP